MWTSNVGFAIYNRPNAQAISPINLKDHRFANPRADGANPGWALFIRHQVGSQARSRSSNNRKANNNAAPLYNTQ